MHNIVQHLPSYKHSARAVSSRAVRCVVKPVNPTVKGRELDDKVTADMTLQLGRVGRSKDMAAFEMLFRHFGPRIRAFMLKRACDGSQAEELMQETMMMVWRKADQFDPERGNAAAWIFTIARNVRIDNLRKTKRPEFDPNDPAFSPGEPQAPDIHFEKNQNADRIRRALSELPVEQADLLRMSFFEELPHSQIAEKTNLPLGTVKSRIRAAFSRLRYVLGENR